jgi:hypothetical protein
MCEWSIDGIASVCDEPRCEFQGCTDCLNLPVQKYPRLHKHEIVYNYCMGRYCDHCSKLMITGYRCVPCKWDLCHKCLEKFEQSTKYNTTTNASASTTTAASVTNDESKQNNNKDLKLADIDPLLDSIIHHIKNDRSDYQAELQRLTESRLPAKPHANESEIVLVGLPTDGTACSGPTELHALRTYVHASFTGSKTMWTNFTFDSVHDEKSVLDGFARFLHDEHQNRRHVSPVLQHCARYTVGINDDRIELRGQQGLMWNGTSDLGAYTFVGIYPWMMMREDDIDYFIAPKDRLEMQTYWVDLGKVSGHTLFAFAMPSYDGGETPLLACINDCVYGSSSLQHRKPNCAIVRFYDRGFPRAGVMTIRNIKPGESLEADYRNPYWIANESAKLHHEEVMTEIKKRKDKIQECNGILNNILHHVNHMATAAHQKAMMIRMALQSLIS